MAGKNQCKRGDVLRPNNDLDGRKMLEELRQKVEKECREKLLREASVRPIPPHDIITKEMWEKHTLDVLKTPRSDLDEKLVVNQLIKGAVQSEKKFGFIHWGKICYDIKHDKYMEASWRQDMELEGFEEIREEELQTIEKRHGMRWISGEKVISFLSVYCVNQAVILTFKNEHLQPMTILASTNSERISFSKIKYFRNGSKLREVEEEFGQGGIVLPKEKVHLKVTCSPSTVALLDPNEYSVLIHKILTESDGRKRRLPSKRYPVKFILTKKAPFDPTVS